MARRYVAAGITCVIDDAIFPQWRSVSYAGWCQLLPEPARRLVVLMLSFAAVAERNAHRHGRRLLAPEMLSTIYDMMTPWCEQSDYHVIDTSTLSIAKTALAIEQAVASMREQGSSGSCPESAGNWFLR